MKLRVFSHRYSFPSSQTPGWSSLVERWYQLDAPAFGLAEIYWRHKAELKSAPEWIFLASPGASNFTDHQFSLGSTPSPAKFVHTLPNVRGAPLLQLLGWSGPVLCVQNDPSTIVSALNEAIALKERRQGPVWVASCFGGPDVFHSYIFVIADEGRLKIHKTPVQALAKEATRDKDWLSWLNSAEHGLPAVSVGEYEISHAES